MGLRPRSGSSALVLFLFLIFVLVGLVLLLFGFSLGDLDRWIDANAGSLDAVASLLFQALCGLILLVCILTVIMVLFGRKGADRLGWGYAVGAALVGYFAWFGMIGD
jgi:NADH:ubiquinone oxidoreductase subunit 6 (subunit J)